MSNISAKIVSIEPYDDIEKPVSQITTEDSQVQPSVDMGMGEVHAAGKGWVWGLTLFAALIWIGVVAMALWLSFGSLSAIQALSAPQWAGLAALTILPLMMMGVLAYALRRLNQVTQQSLRLSAAADAISKPDAALEARAQSLAGAVRSQVIAVNSGLEKSMERMAGMETVLRGHVDALTNSHIAATRQTGEITQRLAEERDGLRSISENFDERMAALSHMMKEHNERLTQSAEIAEQKIHEARVSVEGAAAKINASSEIVRDNALAATQTLTDSQDHITKLGEGIKSQSESLDVLNARHAADLTALLEQLRQEQSEMNTMIEARLDKMRDMSLSAKVSAQSLAEASDAGRQTVEALAQSANLADSAVKARFAEMEDMVRYSNSRAESISDRAAKRVRDSLALTRLEIGRIEDDMRELEHRIAESSLGVDDRSIEARDVTPKPKWRKSLLKFRPITDEDDAPEPAKAGPLNALRKPIFSVPDTVPQKEAPPVQPVAPVSPVQPDALAARAPAPPAPIAETPISDATSDLNLSLDTNGEIDMDIPNPNADILRATYDEPSPGEISISRPIDSEPRLRKKAKSSWRWRNLLGGVKSEPAINLTAEPSQEFAPISDEAIIARLTQMGLAPNDIVDEGCIIEAVNTRKSKGASDMRAIIENRLPGPVSHLRSAMDSDLNFKRSLSEFSRSYAASLAYIEDDREAMRVRFETQTGRAFILVDSAVG